MKTNNDALALGVLIKRNIKLYLKEKMLVFFSVLAPILVLLLYILFLGKMQVDLVGAELGKYGLDSLNVKDIQTVINNWMIAGVMGISCVTVCINTNMVMLKDKYNGNINDMLSSPVKKWVIYLSYIISGVVITITICFLTLFIAIIYLACMGQLFMGFVDFLAICGITLLSAISASFFMTFICSFLKSPSGLTAINSVFGTILGFLIGAYLPFSMMPNGLKYVSCLIPWTYSVCLFKEYFMHGVVGHLESKYALDIDGLKGMINDKFSISIDFFGHEVSVSWMTMILIISIVLFALVMILFYSNKRTNYFSKHVKQKKGAKKAKAKIKNMAQKENKIETAETISVENEKASTEENLKQPENS